MSSSTQEITANSSTSIASSEQSWRTYCALIFNARMMAVLLLGFSSGLPLALSGSTLQAWYTVSGINLVAIGSLSLVGMPYVWKFIWAPILDRYIPPFLGRRNGWMLIAQVAIIFLLIWMATLHPKHNEILMGFIALGIAFSSATQDTAINAYMTEIVKPEERGLSAAMNVGGYRIAMLVSGAFALIIAAYIGWQATYILMAACMSIGVLVSIFGPKMQHEPDVSSSLWKVTANSFMEFLKRRGAVMILLTIVLYKIGDAFAMSLTSTFLLRGLHFTLIEVGLVSKVTAITGSLLGVFVGGIWMSRIGLYRALMIFGILQLLSNFTYMALAMVGPHLYFAAFAIFFENLCGGLATAAFVAFIMSLCDLRFTATQFALFSALSAVGRVIVGPFSGLMVEHVGWVQFYFWTVIFAVPGLVFLWLIRHNSVFQKVPK